MNPHLAMAVLAAACASMQANRKGPRGRLARRLGRCIEYKDLDGATAAALQEIKGGIAAVGDRLKNVEAAQGELKSLDKDVKAFKADLEEIKKGLPVLANAPEFKSLDEFSKGLKKQLDEIERKINEAVISSKGGGKKERLQDRASFKSLDAAMRSKQDIEIKSLDSDLKTQDIFFDGQAELDFPLLGMCFKRPTRSDLPKYSYYTGMTMGIKGGAADVQGARKKVELAVVDYEYQPTLDRSDVEDAGAQLLADELAAAAYGTKEVLNANLIDAVEAAELASANWDTELEYDTKVEMIETDVSSVIDDDDLNDLIQHMPVRYRRGAVMIASPAMVTTLKGITSEATGQSIWQPSLAEGTPATLKGYQFIEDDNVLSTRIIFVNPRWGLAIAEREAPNLSNIERSGGDYQPYYAARYGRGLTNCRAIKILKIQA